LAEQLEAIAARPNAGHGGAGSAWLANAVKFADL
jgi:hypothetical protein